MILNPGIVVLFLVTCPAEDRRVSLQKNVFLLLGESNLR